MSSNGHSKPPSLVSLFGMVTFLAFYMFPDFHNVELDLNYEKHAAKP